MIDLHEVTRDRSAPGTAERVRAMSYIQNPRIEVLFENALRAMGSTPDEIAEALRSREIRGRRGSSQSCPVARLLAPNFEGFYVETYSTAASLRAGGPNGDVVAWVDLPAPVALFIDAFDNPDGPYADLVDRSRPAVSYDPNEVVSREDIAREHGAPWLS